MKPNQSEFEVHHRIQMGIPSEAAGMFTQGGSMNRIACITDSDEFRYPADEPESLLTDVEQEIEWLCDDWQQALADDTYDTWRDVRMMVYGATQMLNQVGRHYETSAALNYLGTLAFDNGLVCLKAGKYEGAQQ